MCTIFVGSIDDMMFASELMCSWSIESH